MNNSANPVEHRLRQRLQRIIKLHFDPDQGSPYWLDKQNRLGIDVRSRIQALSDLSLLGLMDEEAMTRRPVEDFIPQCMHHRTDFIFAETAGTLGNPKFAVHREDEFRQAFIAPFITAAKRNCFPVSGKWLFIGPTGPHIIGKAAFHCAKAMGCPDIFTVDFDPRWAKKLKENSFAAQRYLSHIQSQALRIIETQAIDVLFTTPAVLISLADQLAPEKRCRIRGIHLGGMSSSDALMRMLAEKFPTAAVLSGFGNTLFGMMPQLRYDSREGFDYYPLSDRLIVQVMDVDEQRNEPTSWEPVDYGTRGRILVHRLDEVQFIANMLERDSAIRIPPLNDAVDNDFILDGIRDPQPVMNQTIQPALGLY